MEIYSFSDYKLEKCYYTSRFLEISRYGRSKNLHQHADSATFYPITNAAATNREIINKF